MQTLPQSNDKLKNLKKLKDPKFFKNLPVSQDKLQDFKNLKDPNFLQNLPVSQDKLTDLKNLKDPKLLQNLPVSQDKLKDLKKLKDSTVPQDLPITNLQNKDSFQNLISNLDHANGKDIPDVAVYKSPLSAGLVRKSTLVDNEMNDFVPTPIIYNDKAKTVRDVGASVSNFTENVTDQIKAKTGLRSKLDNVFSKFNVLDQFKKKNAVVPSLPTSLIYDKNIVPSTKLDKMKNYIKSITDPEAKDNLKTGTVLYFIFSIFNIETYFLGLKGKFLALIGKKSNKVQPETILDNEDKVYTCNKFFNLILLNNSPES